MTPTPTLFLLRTPTFRATNRMILTLAPTPLPLRLTPPTCYETPVGGLLCLGAVRNHLEVAATQVSVRVYLVASDGTPLAFRDTLTAHAALEPGGLSPYSVLFETTPKGAVGPVVQLIGAQKATTGTHTLAIRDLNGGPEPNAFHVAGKVINTGQRRVSKLQVVITLFDSRARVTGYRQLRLVPAHPLSPFEGLVFESDIIPQGLGTTRFEVSAEWIQE